MEPEEEPNVAAAREVCEEVSFFIEFQYNHCIQQIPKHYFLECALENLL